jgi:predicted RNA-binding Zn-ribbon protein involved in translation (DUF1610 family)
MLELIAIWCFGRAIYETARHKGRNGWIWVLLLIVAWFGAEIAGAVAFSLGGAILLGAVPNRLLIYLGALGAALAAGLTVGKILDGRPALVPPRLPIRPRRRAATRVPPEQMQRAPTQLRSPEPFKFSCPHCGQRIATSVDQAATQANCPTCNELIIVPSPGA